jgi:hypothetical protein
MYESNTQVVDEFGNLTTGVKCTGPNGGCGEYHPVRVYPGRNASADLPREDRDYCTKHGTNAKPQPQSEPEPEPEPEPQPQPPRVISVGRTRPLYDVSSGCSTLDKIEDILNRAIMEGEFTVRQRNIMRWALRKCHSTATELREEFESL